MLVQLKNYKLLLGRKSLFEMGVGEMGSIGSWKSKKAGSYSTGLYTGSRVKSHLKLSPKYLLTMAPLVLGFFKEKVPPKDG
jgi:hypothetical protein